MRRRSHGEEVQYFVYILASGRHGTLYIGVTGNLLKRMWEHREALVDGFTKRYEVKRLVHYEALGDVRTAIQREKTLKKWRREWKVNLIERDNPEWTDLFPVLAGTQHPVARVHVLPEQVRR